MAAVHTTAHRLLGRELLEMLETSRWPMNPKIVAVGQWRRNYCPSRKHELATASRVAQDFEVLERFPTLLCSGFAVCAGRVHAADEEQLVWVSRRLTQNEKHVT